MMILTLLYACEFKLPKGVVQGSEYKIESVAKTLPKSNEKLTVSGTIIIKDACTITLKDLVYIPQIQQVFVYASDAANINDSNANGEQISDKEVSHSAFSGTEQDIILTTSIENAKSIKLFGSRDKFVIGASSISSASVKTFSILVTVAILTMM